MATFEKRVTPKGRKRFRASVRRAGFKPIKATFDTLTEAREWAAKKETEINSGKYQLTNSADQHSVGEMIANYLKTVMPNKSRKLRYTKQQETQLNWWWARIGEYRLSHVTPALLAKQRDELLENVSHATANRYMAALSHVFTTAIKVWAWLEQSPIARLEKLKESRGRVRFLSDAEREALLRAVRLEKHKPLELIVMLALSTGARKMEILSLKWQDVDFERGIATVQESKNNERRPLFITGVALEMLKQHKRHPKSDYVFPSRFGNLPVDIEKEWRTALARAKINNFHFHDLRHTFASYVAMNGGTTADIGAALGHKSAAMVQRYAHLSKTHTAGVVADMTAKFFPITQPTGDSANAKS